MGSGYNKKCPQGAETENGPQIWIPEIELLLKNVLTCFYPSKKNARWRRIKESMKQAEKMKLI